MKNNVIILSLLSCNLLNAVEPVKEVKVEKKEVAQARADLRKALEDNNILGIILNDNNRVLFYSEDGCQKFANCQWCALQSKGDFAGWYECQGKRGANLGLAIKETASEASESTKKFANKAGETIKDFAVDIAETTKDFASKTGEFLKENSGAIADTTVDMANKSAEVAKRTGKRIVEGTKELASDIKKALMPVQTPTLGS